MKYRKSSNKRRAQGSQHSIIQFENYNSETIMKINSQFSNPLAPIPMFKVIIIGDGGVGKSTFSKRTVPQYVKPYMNLKYQYNQIIIQTTQGPIRVSMADTAGQQKFGGLRDAYYIGAKAAIIMFDVTSRITYKNIPKWHKQVTRICQDIPIIIVGNKIDLKERKVKPHQITFHRKYGLKYFDISAKSNYGIEQCYLCILSQLIGDKNLALTQKLNLQPPLIHLQAQKIEFLKKQWEEAVKKNVQKDELEYQDDFY